MVISSYSTLPSVEVLRKEYLKLRTLEVNVVDRVLEFRDDSGIPFPLTLEELSGRVRRKIKYSDLDRKAKYDWKYAVDGKEHHSRNFNVGEVDQFLLFNPDIVDHGTIYVADALDLTRNQAIA